MDPIVVEAAYLAARVMEANIRSQSPSEKIAGGTTVLPVFENDEVRFEVVLADQVKYGIFLDSGTMREYKPNPNAAFNPNPGKGDDGIKPRYWTNMDETFQERITQIMERAMTEAIEKNIDKQLEKI
jgi:hypothetical protein